MAIEPQIQTIDEATYHFTPLAARASRQVYPRIILESAKIFFALATEKVEALSAVDPNFIQFLHDHFEGSCRVDLGAGPQPLKPLADAHFGRLGMLHENKWLLFVLEAQYPDFLGELKTRAKDAIEKALRAQGTASGKESTKESGSSPQAASDTTTA